MARKPSSHYLVGNFQALRSAKIRTWTAILSIIAIRILRMEDHQRQSIPLQYLLRFRYLNLKRQARRTAFCVQALLKVVKSSASMLDVWINPLDCTIKPMSLVNLQERPAVVRWR
jgi:hypothetical protein